MYDTYSMWGSFGMVVLTTMLATAAAFGALRGLDRLSGIKFGRDVFSVLSKSPIALAIYITGRFAAVLGFMAYQFGRFF